MVRLQIFFLLPFLGLFAISNAAHLQLHQLEARATTSVSICTAWNSQCKSACTGTGVTVNTCQATASDTYAFGCQCYNGTWTSDFTMRRVLGLSPMNVTTILTQTQTSTQTKFIATTTNTITSQSVIPTTVTVTVDGSGNTIGSSNSGTAPSRRYLLERRDVTSNATANAFCQSYSSQCAAQCAATSAYLVGNNTCTLVRSNPDFYQVGCSCVYGPPKIIAPTAILSRILGSATPDTTATLTSTKTTQATATATLTLNATTTVSTTATVTATSTLATTTSTQTVTVTAVAPPSVTTTLPPYQECSVATPPPSRKRSAEYTPAPVARRNEEAQLGKRDASTTTVTTTTTTTTTPPAATVTQTSTPPPASQASIGTVVSRSAYWYSTALGIKYALVDAVGGRIGFANNNNGWTTVGQTSTSGRWGDYQGNYPQRVDLSTGLLHSPSDRTPITGCQSYVTCTKGSNLSLNCQDEATGTLNTFYSCPASDGVLVAYLFTASAPPSPGCTIRTDMVVSGL